MEVPLRQINEVLRVVYVLFARSIQRGLLDRPKLHAGENVDHRIRAGRVDVGKRRCMLLKLSS